MPNWEFEPIVLPEEEFPVAIKAMTEAHELLYVPEVKTIKRKERLEYRIGKMLEHVNDLRQDLAAIDTLYDHQLIVNLRLKDMLRTLWEGADTQAKEELVSKYKVTLEELGLIKKD